MIQNRAGFVFIVHPYLQGRQCRISFDETDSIQTLLQRLYQQHGDLAAIEWRLYFAGMVLDNSCIAADYNIASKSVLILDNTAVYRERYPEQPEGIRLQGVTPPSPIAPNLKDAPTPTNLNNLARFVREASQGFHVQIFDKFHKRVRKEIDKLSESPSLGVSSEIPFVVNNMPDGRASLLVQMRFPTTVTRDSNCLQLLVEITRDYPWKPFTLWCLSEFKHPVDILVLSTGQVIMPMIGEGWTPAFSVQQGLETFRAKLCSNLMAHQQPALPLHMHECGSTGYVNGSPCQLCEQFCLRGLLWHAAEVFRGNRQRVLSAVKQNRYALKWAPNFRSDPDIVLAAIEAYESAVEYADESLFGNRDFVEKAVQVSGMVLERLPQVWKNDQDIVLKAIAQNVAAWQFTPAAFKQKVGDRIFVTAALQVNGMFLQHASDDLRADKDIVKCAVRQNSASLKYAGSGLNQDEDCLKAAAIWANSENDRHKSRHEKAIYSVRFSLSSKSTDYATCVCVALLLHPELGQFDIYFPSAFEKDSCDKDYTSFAWPCRGTTQTCMAELCKRSGTPTNSHCWRYSFRHRQEICCRSRGFMLQLEEWIDGKYQLGAGQIIELHMALQAGLKVFTVRQGRDIWMNQRDFDEEDANEVAEAVLKWYDDGALNKSIAFVKLRDTM